MSNTLQTPILWKLTDLIQRKNTYNLDIEWDKLISVLVLLKSILVFLFDND